MLQKNRIWIKIAFASQVLSVILQLLFYDFAIGDIQNSPVKLPFILFFIAIIILGSILYMELKKLQNEIIKVQANNHYKYYHDYAFNKIHDIKNQTLFLYQNFDTLSDIEKKDRLNSEMEDMKETLSKMSQLIIEKSSTFNFLKTLLESEKMKFAHSVNFEYTLDISSTDSLSITTIDSEIILQNLISNAYHATLRRDIRIINVYVSKKNIRVSDNGVGFKSPTSNTFSTKIGLNEIRKLALIYKGKVLIKSNSNGSIVTFKIPK